MEDREPLFYLNNRRTSAVMILACCVLCVFLALVVKIDGWGLIPILGIVSLLFVSLAISFNGLTTEHKVDSEGIAEYKWNILKNKADEVARFDWKDIVAITIWQPPHGSTAQFQIKGSSEKVEKTMYLTSYSDEELKATHYVLTQVPRSTVQDKVLDYIEKKARAF